jgi:hypothetical protein
LLDQPLFQGKLPVSVGPPLRAPTADGAVLAVPPLTAVGQMLEINRGRLRRPDADVLGRPWDDLRRAARHAAVAAAREYLTSLGEPVPATEHEHLLIAGHQPELFHAGVWIKHFALHGLSHRHQLTALNLVVDNDTVKSTALRVPHPPTPQHPWPYAASVSFDRWTGEAPYEERAIVERRLFQQFAETVQAILRPWPLEPLLGPFWEEVLRCSERTPLLGACFAGARRTFERRWGCHNLEVPVSAICRTEPFAWFACHLLSDLPRFHAAYNDCAQDYRRRHGIRSSNHPVPDLATDGDFCETPFWGWRRGQTRRGRLFARLAKDCLELRSGTEAWPTLPSPKTDPLGAVAAWQELERDGYKVRSRALTNTLYARLFLGELFVHGIGGGKYDELTDAILQRFYGCQPPLFLVLTGTRLLPLPALSCSSDERRRLIRQVRDVHYHPEHYLPAVAGLDDLAREKQAWIERTPATALERRERFEMIRKLTAALRGPQEGEEQRLRDELARCEKQLEANAVLRQRDYAFCLYPDATLRPFLTQML